MTDEPQNLPLDEEELDDKQLHELETQVPIIVNLKDFLYHHLTTYPEWEARPMP